MLRLWTKFRVWSGIFIAAGATTVARPCYPAVLGGVTCMLLGALWRLWAAGYIRKNDTLTLSGPYAWHRNPLYFGSFLTGVGIGICAHRTLYWPIYLIYFAGVYGYTIRSESSYLERKFGQEFIDYRERVPAWWPLGGLNRLRPRPARSESWSWNLVRQHREHVTLSLVLFWAGLFMIIWFLQGRSVCDIP